MRDEVTLYDDTLRQTDLTNILEALDYISEYPQVFHHPTEEAAMDILEERNLGDNNMIQRIRHQHIEIEKETRELVKLFDMIYNDHAVPISRVKEQLARYYDLQFVHLETEDKHIMPLFDQYLSDEDWQRVASKVKYIDDPLFHPHYVESYRELSQHLGLR